MDDQTLIRLDGVKKVFYTDEVETHALGGIHLDIKRGEYVSIAGPSGCGKSTLLSIFGLLDTPTGGEYWLNGKPVANLTMRERARTRNREIGFIFQNFNLIPVLSAYENIEYALLLAKLSAAERRSATTSILKDVGLYDHRHQRPNQLSGGQQQRVAIARALVKQPALVLADEPTANLDSKTGEAIVALMRRMQENSRTTFVFSTHDPALMQHAEETFTIRDGSVVDHRIGAAK
jgi:putative ABC transport system ATP-binding protein